jgi:L-lysine exporter family protein LysE/ArgO
MIPALLAGFMLGLSLIIVIGPQNAFVLRQGLQGRHVLAVSATCALSDLLLILAGVGGFADLSARFSGLEPLLRYGGAAFLLIYGGRSLLSAWRGQGGLTPADSEDAGRLAAIVTCLGLTWLNPHVYLDTVVLLGSLSTGYPGNQWFFAAGAGLASLTFFFSLGYGARWLRPVFAAPLSWRLLDAGIGLMMAGIAFSLLFPLT